MLCKSFVAAQGTLRAIKGGPARFAFAVGQRHAFGRLIGVFSKVKQGCARACACALFSSLALISSVAWADISYPNDKADATPGTLPEPLQDETIDRYAERLLQLRLLSKARAEIGLPAAKDTAAAGLQNIGEVGPNRFELVYIIGNKDQTRAHLRIDGRYTKLAKVGEHVAGWYLHGIGNDYVDIAKDGDSTRLYMNSISVPQGRAER